MAFSAGWPGAQGRALSSRWFPSSPCSRWRLSPRQPHTAHPDTAEGRRLGLGTEARALTWGKRQPAPAGPALGGRESVRSSRTGHCGTGSPSWQGFSASLSWQGKGMPAPRPQSANSLVGRAGSQLAWPFWPPASSDGCQPREAWESTKGVDIRHAGVVLALGRGGHLHPAGGTPTLGTEPVWSGVQTASRAPRQRPTGHPPGRGLKQHPPPHQWS